jgi:hypothetical protein
MANGQRLCNIARNKIIFYSITFQLMSAKEQPESQLKSYGKLMTPPSPSRE